MAVGRELRFTVREGNEYSHVESLPKTIVGVLISS